MTTKAEAYAARMQALNIPVYVTIVSNPQPSPWVVALLAAAEQRHSDQNQPETPTIQPKRLSVSSSCYQESKQLTKRP